MTNTQQPQALDAGPADPLKVLQELAEYASYAEIVGGVSVNRPQIRKWCDEAFALLQAAPEASATSGVLGEVAVERRRQDERYGGPAHDDEHDDGDLIAAGVVYALDGLQGMYGRGAEAIISDAHKALRPLSPCGHSPSDRRRSFIKAIACMVAEVERLDRLAGEGSANG